MGYHIFEINPFKQLTFLQSSEHYPEAKKIIKELRRNPDIVSGTTYRMMFAADADQAERLLKEKREPRPMGEHD